MNTSVPKCWIAIQIVLTLCICLGAPTLAETPQPAGGGSRIEILHSLGENFQAARITRDAESLSRRISLEKASPARPSGDLDRVDPKSVAGTQEWSALLEDSFDSGLLQTEWIVEFYGTAVWWDDWTCWSHSSPRSVACAAGGDPGIACDEDYPTNFETWLIAGPFDFSDERITGAVLETYLNLRCQYAVDGVAYDGLFMGVSGNGVDWEGGVATGTWDSYASIDLIEQDVLGGIVGQSVIWIGFCFWANDVTQLPNGAQIDDVLLAVDGLPVNGVPVVEVVAPNGGETLTGGDICTIEYTATDPDGDSEALELSFDYSVDAGWSWTEIATGRSNTGTCDWTLPEIDAIGTRVRVRADDGTDVGSDSSDASFTIVMPVAENHLSLLPGAGRSGESAVMALDLDNNDAVRSLRAEIEFDPAACFFLGVEASGRAQGMGVAWEKLAADRVAIAFSLPDDELEPGSGSIGSLTFGLQGGGSTTDLAFTDVQMLDAAGEPLRSAGVDGTLSVEAPLAAPQVHLRIVQNPGSARSLTIFVDVVGGSGAAPVLTVDGETVAVEALGDAAWVARHHADASAQTAVIVATDGNAIGTGSASRTLEFE